MVTPIVPKNQDRDVQSYFKLKSKPGESQTLFVRIENLKNEPIVVLIETDNALTSPMGEIQYIPGEGNENARITDPSHEMKDAISVQRQVKLNAKEKKEIPISVRAPAYERGTFLGGITFIAELQQGDKVTEEHRDSNAYYFDIESRIGFALAIQWDMPIPETDQFAIEKAGIRLIPSGVQSYIEIQNVNANILSGFSAVYHIKKKNGTELFSGQITNINFAPKTLIRYPIMWRGAELSSGDFILEIEARIGDSIQSKNIDFQINKAFIQQYINETGNQISNGKEGISILKISIGVGSILVVFIIAMLIGAKKKKKDEEDNS